MNGDDIIDAEWDEVPEERPVSRPARLTRQKRGPSRPLPQPGPEDAPSPWQSRVFWHDTLGTILIVVGRIGLIALGLIVLFVLVIAWADHKGAETSNLSQVTEDRHSPADRSVDAEEMLRSWSQAVTGHRNDAILAMVNGSGKPGDFCSNADGDTLLMFGGGETNGVRIYDLFAEFHPTTQSGTVGAFWFDPTDGSLLTRNQARVDSKGQRGRSVPDRTHDVAFDGEGRAVFDDIAYHVCTL